MFRRQFGKIAVILALASAATLATTTSAQAATPCPNLRPPVPQGGSVENLGPVAIGVIHLADGNCARPNYDVLLRPGQDTFHSPIGWREVAGVYLGPGYGAVANNKDTGEKVVVNPSSNGGWWLDPMLGGDWAVSLFRG